MSAGSSLLRMNASSNANARKSNQNIQVYLRVRPTNDRERLIRSHEMVEVSSNREVIVKQTMESKSTKKFTFDRAFGPDSKQSDVYHSVVAPLIEEVLAGYNCTVFAYGQTGTGKTHTMVGDEIPTSASSWEDDSELGIIPRALSQLFQELRLMGVEFSMRVSYLELYNEELCDLLSTSDSAQIRIFDDANKKGSIIVQGLEEIPVHSTYDVYKLLAKGQEKRKTASTLMNAQSSRSHTIFSILVHIRENGIDGEELLKIGKLNLVDLAGSENLSKAGNEKGIRTRETVNINQSLLTLGRVITALVERTPHIPYRESKLTRLLQESLGGRTKTSIIATVSPGHKDLEETLSTLEYAHRAKNIQNKPEINQKLTKKTVLKEYTEEIDRLKRDLIASRDKNGIYLAEETYSEMQFRLESQNKDLNEKEALVRALKDEMASKQRIFNEISLSLVERTTELQSTQASLVHTSEELGQTKNVLRTTKRRYQEKKHLLENHVQTEEQLIGQATALIDVVESASTDTYRLHDTIERRRTVDVKLQSASEKHAQAMDKDLLAFNESVEQMLVRYQNHSAVHIDELAKNANESKRNASATISKLNTLLLTNQTSSNRLGDCQRSQTNEITKELLAQHAANKKQLGDNAISIKQMSAEAAELLKATNGSLKQQTERSVTHHRQLDEITTKSASAATAFCTKHCDASNAFLSTVKQFIDRNETCNSQLRDDIKQSDHKLREMHQLFQQMYDEVQQSNERNANRIEDNSATLKDLLEAIERNNTQTITEHEQFASDSQISYSEQSQHLATWNDDVLRNAKDAEESVNRLLCENSKLQLLLDEQVALIMKQLEQQHQSIVDRIRVLQNEITELDAQATVAFKVDTEQIIGDLQSAVNRHDDWNSVCVSLNNAMARDIVEYGESVNSHVLECRERLEDFHRKDMQTYRSTGDTPAKREFNYPKQLVQTSPHDRLVRKFWTNFNGTLSELDCSVTICEGNESTFLDGITDEKSSSMMLAIHQKAHPEILVSPSVDPIGSRTLRTSTSSNISNDSTKTLKPHVGRRSGSSAPTSPVSRSRSSSGGRKLSTSAKEKENVY